jgi:DNA polymerase-4
MTESLAFDLRKMQKLTACVTVKLRYSDFQTFTIQKHVHYTANDQMLLQVVKELFDRLYDRRVLVRMVGIRFSNLVQGSPQIALFDDTVENVSLCQAMDKIRNKFGNEAVQRAIGLGK